MITKTAYLSYSHCSKRFWLAQHRPYLATPPDPAAQRRLQAGQEVDRLAREQFPDGTHIPYRPHPEDMTPLTEQAIADGAKSLFQATFSVEDLLIKADILTRTEAGWHLIEVKSTTRVKEEEHLPDIAFQLYVLQKAGLNVTLASVMHLNRVCRYPELTNLFTLTNVTEKAQDLLPLVEAGVAIMRHILRQLKPPDVGIGRFCTRPYACPFYDQCWRNVDGLTIYDIARLGAQKEHKLQSDGILYLPDIPYDFPLTTSQRAFVGSITQEQVNIDRNAIQGALNGLDYPLYFLDFETIDHAIPVYSGCSPYQQVPFQYSCHVLLADGTLSHHEYLHTEAGDPRPALAEALLQDVGQMGHVIAYYAPFERRIIRELVEALPEHTDRLLNIANRLWDQLDIFKRHYRHHAFGKSNSLKSVLPVVVPELSYEPLAVQDGPQAQAVWEQMIASENHAERERLAIRLREYCHLDTLAMVEIHRALSSL
jgi:hypothetical protein